MNSTSYETTRAELFRRLKALFEFDANGVLPCMAPGMSGPMALPVGYLDVSNLKLNGQPLGTALVLTWEQAERAHLVSARTHRGVSKSETREASNEELRYALEHYEKAVGDYRQAVLERCVPSGEEAPVWLKKRLGLVPFFQEERSTTFGTASGPCSLSQSH